MMTLHLDRGFQGPVLLEGGGILNLFSSFIDVGWLGVSLQHWYTQASVMCVQANMFEFMQRIRM